MLTFLYSFLCYLLLVYCYYCNMKTEMYIPCFQSQQDQVTKALCYNAKYLMFNIERTLTYLGRTSHVQIYMKINMRNHN
jgi:hypothetical protein